MNKIRDGDLCKVVTVFGKTFELRYGYYDECERDVMEPIPIYPDFKINPEYTEDGIPFVTMMQDSCECYKGEVSRTYDITCADCKYFKPGEEWFGLCTCESKKQLRK